MAHPQNNGPQEYSSPDNNNPEGPDQGGDNNENVNVETEVHPGTLDKIEDDFLYMENEKFKIDQSTEYLKVTVSQINNDPDGSLEEVNTEIITAKDLEPGDNLLIFTANSKAVTVKKIVE